MGLFFLFVFFQCYFLKLIPPSPTLPPITPSQRVRVRGRGMGMVEGMRRDGYEVPFLCCERLGSLKEVQLCALQSSRGSRQFV